MNLALARVMKKPIKREIGMHYEDQAVDYLSQKGYEIIARNVIYRFGEIDVVAKKGCSLVFVEVRKRDPKYGIAPEETITFPKQQRLLKSVQAYLARYRGRETQVRIDLIGFKGDSISHFEDFIRI
jgi:putative endonuclease